MAKLKLIVCLALAISFGGHAYATAMHTMKTTALVLLKKQDTFRGIL